MQEDGEHAEQDEEQHGSRARLRTLAEGVDKIILIRKRQRSGGHSIHTSGRGRLPDFIRFSSQLARIRNIFFYLVGSDVCWQMIEEEYFEQETILLVHPVVQREQESHLPYQSRGFLVGGQGERHNSLIPLESVEGVSGEAFLEGLVGQHVWRELDEVHYLSCNCMTQSTDTVVKLRLEVTHLRAN